MFFYEHFNILILNSLELLVKQNILHKDSLKNQIFNIEIPPNSKFGDISTNVAMVYSKKSKISLANLAKKIQVELLKNKFIVKIDIVSPGFLNIFLEKSYWYSQLDNILSPNKKKKKRKKKKINIEFVSANPTGLMHIGHARGAVLGDTIASILEAMGHQVTREYYINDAGNQIELLVETIKFYFNNFNNNIEEPLPQEFYPGEYIKKIARIIYENSKKEKDYNENLFLRNESVSLILKDIKKDLKKLGVIHDIYTSEKKISTKKQVEIILNSFKEQDLIYEGFQDPPRGVNPKDWKPKKQTLFRSKLLKDDSDRSLVKPDGGLTYFMTDIIYHKKKINEDYDVILNIWGIDHSGYVARLKNAIKSLFDKSFKFEIKLTALVNLIKNKKSLKMSKRDGVYITLRDVIDEVGKDALRFMMISRSSEKIIDFDFDLIKTKTKDNPVFYVQYAHTRCNSIIKIAKEKYELEFNYDELDLSSLLLEEEIELIKLISSFEKVLYLSAIYYEPHRLTNFLYELSKKFHSYWSMGINDQNKRILIESNIKLSCARLGLIIGVKNIIYKGLKILDIKAPDKM